MSNDNTLFHHSNTDHHYRPSITYSSDCTTPPDDSFLSLHPLSPSPLPPTIAPFTLSNMISSTVHSHNHTRSLSQPAIPLSQDQPIAFLPNQQQLLDLMAEHHDSSLNQQQLPPPQHNHALDMSRFLDFAVEASILLETLHQNGLIHGQLCPTSFRWEESSSLKKAIEAGLTTTNSSTAAASTGASSSSPIGVPAASSNTTTHKAEQESYALLTSTLTGTNPTSASTTNSTSSNSTGGNNASSTSRTSFQSHPSRKDNHTSPASLSRTQAVGNNTTTITSSNINTNNTNGISNNQSNSSIGGTNSGKPGRRQRRYSLVLDCTHLGLGEKSSEPPDSPARKGLRDQNLQPLVSPPQSASSSPSTSSLTNGSFENIHSTIGGSNSTIPTNANSVHNNAGSFMDPLLFSPSDANLQPYSTTNSAAAFHDAVAARMARIKRSLLPSSSSSPILGHSSSHSSSTSSSTPPAQSGSTSTGASGSPLPSALKRHFMLHVPQELHSPPGCVLPVQIDIYTLGVMFYYQLTSYTILLPEDMLAGSIEHSLTASSAYYGYGQRTGARGAVLASTPSRLANVIQRMVAKSSKDRFLSMIQVRKELSLIRDQELEASNKEIESKPLPRTHSDNINVSAGITKPSQTHLAPSSYSSSSLARPASPANSTHSFKSTSTRASQEIDVSAIGSRIAASTSTSPSSHSQETNGGGLSYEDRAFVLESVLNLSHNMNLRDMLRAISHALDNILVGHPPEEMAIILWQKDEHLPGGGTWAIIEDKFQPGNTTQSTLHWTDLSERRDHMPVLVRKALDTQEPIFSTAVGSRSQLPTIACVPIVAGPQQQQPHQSWGTSGTSSPSPSLSISSTTSTSSSTLVGAIYLHHLHPRFYFTKRDQDMLLLFCQKLAPSLVYCDKVSNMERQLTLATSRSRVLEETNARIRKNEDEVFSWMEALPCFVWAAEPDDIASRRYLSRSWFEFTGFPGDKRTSDRWISAMHPDDVAAFQKEVSQSYKTGVYKDCEFRLMRYDGVYRWHLSRAIPVLNQYGAILKWVGVTIDIDDLYLAQKAELHKKSNFLANMSHELRTPFSGFHGMLTLLGYSSLDEEQQECVYTAKASCEKLLLIIDDLLDFSKLEADKVTLEASPFDLQEVFDEVEDIVESLASQKALELAFLKTDNVPDVLIGDCNRLKQILLNLVGNAIKFTHTGHVVVKCKVLDRDTDMTALSPGSSSSIDDDKFYFRHEKNGGGQCQSEMRPLNSGRFSSPEPLSESSVKLMFSVEDTGIGISLEEQEVLFSPFSQVDGSATRSYGGSGLGLSICLQLVKLMKGRIGLVSERDKGSTFWFVIQCELGTAAESPIRPAQEVDVVDSTKEIKRITRTLGTPRILIASTSETTISTLQSYLSDFNTEVANLPSTAASRLEESVVNGIRFDFVCWDFPKYDPQHAKMLELQARPDLNNVHFVLLYTPLPSPDLIRRAQSLQLPPSSSSGSPSLASGRKRPTLSQSVSLRLDNSGSVLSNNSNNNAGSMSESEVPGLSPEKLNSLRITCISKPIRRLKLLRAFVEILDDSTRIHGTHVVKKAAASGGNASASSSTPTPIPPTSPTASSATAINSPISSPTNSIGSSTTLSPVGMARTPSLSMMSSLDGTMTKEGPGGVKENGLASGAIAAPTRPSFANADSAVQFLSKSQEQRMINQTEFEVGIRSMLDAPANLNEFTNNSNNKSGHKKQGSNTVNILEVVEEATVLEELAPEHSHQRPRSQSLSASAPSSVASSKAMFPAVDCAGGINASEPSAPSLHHHHTETHNDKATDQEQHDRDAERDRLSTPPPPPKVLPVKKLPVNSSRASKLRSNSPKPTKTSKLVTEEATENSLSLEEANRITGMRILLAEDNKIAQMVLSKQLSLFGLVISCANDGADALTLFKSHPRGYYTMGFFDHHMPNCDGVQATQQIRLLEREHAAEVKGPVPRLPIVAVSADIQETARRACLNSGMERYVTKPLMQKDLVAMVRQYCVRGDAEASTHSYVSPPEGAGVSEGLGVVSSSAESGAVTSTVEAMVSAGHVSAPIGISSGLTGSMLLSPSPIGGGQMLHGSPLQKHQTPTTKRELELSPAAMRGLALIRETTLQDESSKVGGGGSIKPTNVTFPATMTSSASMGSLPTQQQQQQAACDGGANHLGLRSHGSHSQLRTPTSTFSLSKSISSNSLSGSYNAGAGVDGIVSSPIIMSTSTPVVTSSPLPAPGPLATSSSSTSTGLGALSSSFSSHQLLHHHHHPIAAMAAGAAAAAAAVVNTVSSAISEHIHPPSIYAAQPNSSALSSPWKGSLEGQQIQQKEHLLQQPFLLPSFSALSSSEPGGHTYHPAQQVFVPYLHPCEPSPTIGRDEDPILTSGVLSPGTVSLEPSPVIGTMSSTSTSTSGLTGASVSNNGVGASSGSLPPSTTVAGVAGVQAALSATAAASALTGATAKAVAASNATIAATASVQLNNWM